jgi:hypothetical protein
MFPLKPGQYLVLLLCLLSLTQQGSAQVICTPVYLNEYLGTANTPLQPHALKALPDGTTLIVGRAAQPGTTTYYGWISRWAAGGTPIWSFFVGGAGDDNLTGITPLTDCSFLCYGTTTSFGYPVGTGWLVQINANGAVLWSCQLGSSTASTDRIRAIQQYADGDFIGTLNVNDSSAASDPVVFKLGFDATLRWTHCFDNGDDDSYTTLALEGDTVYAGGYYTAAGMQQGVISELNVATGALVQSKTISNGGRQWYPADPNRSRPAIPARWPMITIHTPLMICKRTADTGFYVQRVNDALNDLPSITKVSWYEDLDWIQSMINTSDGNITGMSGQNGSEFPIITKN